jgi:hypothetical protein
MGLDMYLQRKRFLWSEEREKLQISGVSGFNVKNVYEIAEEAMYWRKANHIHKWFVENVQSNKDDCGTYEVTKEQLKSLHNIVKKIIEKPSLASELLPTQKGFFFGGTDYDQYYFDDLKYTNEALEKLLQNWDEKSDYFYHSSW